MPKTTLAPIVRWTVKHEQIVSMHIGGMSNEEIAAAIKIKGKNPSVVRVSQILGDPQALRTIHEAILLVRSQMTEDLDGGLAVLAMTAMKRIAETINFEFFPGTDEKKHQDRLSLDLVKMVYSNNQDTTEEAPPLNEALSERIVEALEASKAADELILEAQFEVVEEDE